MTDLIHPVGNPDLPGARQVSIVPDSVGNINSADPRDWPVRSSGLLAQMANKVIADRASAEKNLNQSLAQAGLGLAYNALRNGG